KHLILHRQSATPVPHGNDTLSPRPENRKKTTRIASGCLVTSSDNCRGLVLREPEVGAIAHARSTNALVPCLPRHAAIEVDDICACGLVLLKVAGGVLLTPPA